MNYIEKFAKEHGADYSKKMARLYKKAVQDTIGDIGRVRQAWTYTDSDDYGYVDWEASVIGVEGMLPEDEIVVVLSTDLDDGTSWISGRYMDEYDTIAELDETSIGGLFDAVSLINNLMSIVQEERSSKGESRKKSEGVGGKIKMGIDYNMFMRMCASAAYLDDNEDYWDALWEYYSEMGEIEDALVFFDNLFQYTAWCDVDELYDEYLDDAYKDKSKSKETCIQEAVDGGDLDAYKHSGGKYLVIL